MKFDPLQGDFSAGEISERTRGKVGTDVYRAALSRAANVVPTRTGSIASRAGGQFLADPVTPQRPVRHFDVQDGPYGDFVVEISATDIRLMDKTGILTWHRPEDAVIAHGLYGAYSDVWYDLPSKTLYINNSDASAARAVDISPLTPDVVGQPFGGGDGTWILDYNLAGDSMTLRVSAYTTDEVPVLVSQDYVLTRGAGRVAFGVGGFSISPSFHLQLLSQAGVVTASTMWGLKLSKNSMKVSNGASPFTNLLTIRASSGFWGPDGKFYVIFVGGGAADIYALRYTPQAGLAYLDAIWDFGVLSYYNSDADFDPTQVATVQVYNSRVWLGMSNKQASLYASVVGYGTTSPHGTNLGAIDPTNPGPFKFRFGNAEVEIVATANVNYTFDFPVPYDPKADNGQFLSVTVNGVVKSYLTDFGTFIFLNTVDDTYFGTISFIAGRQPAVNDIVIIKRVTPLATDPLTLKLAAPTGRICWMAVLRGLVLGTTHTEKTIQQGTIALDPATGQSPDLLDHSSVGSDEALDALSVHEKVVYMQRGRTILRQASVRFNWESGEPQSGLISEDAGVWGEHLTKLKVRSFCFLKSPVPRIVFAFDGGTGAVATPGGAAGMAWSRFTLPDVFGGIYSVAALNTINGSQLWVSTENGVTIYFDLFESDIAKKKMDVLRAAPLSPQHVEYDAETPLPPVMDGWTRVAALRSGARIRLDGIAGGAGITGRRSVSTSLLGQSVYVLTAGQVYGPYLVKNELAGNPYTVDDNSAVPLGFTWVDAAGKRRAQEVYVGIALPEHRFTTLPLEGGNPQGTSQAFTSRRVQCYLRFVDSYMPLAGSFRAPERGPNDPADQAGARVTDDRRVTQLDFSRAALLDVVMDLPLRMEVSAIFGGAQVQSA